MSYIYEPEVEEDNGYSVPKILVAVLLLALIGAGGYIYMQKSKIKDSVARLKGDKKEVKQQLDSLIAIYNLAIEDNDYLKDVYDEEKAKIEEMKTEIDNLPDDANITSFKPQILDIVENQKIIAPTIVNDVKTVSNPIVIETSTDNITELTKDNAISNNEKTNTVTSSVKDKVKTATTPNNEKVNEVSEVAATTKMVKQEDNTVAEQAVTEEKKKEEEKPIKPVITSTSLNKADIPPTYPGCSGTATQKKKCFSSKVRAFVSKEFDVSTASDLGLASGKKRINVSMTIDKYGRVVNIRARGPHKNLENEAIRVVKKLPKMMPARHDGNVVSIKNFFIPIIINIEE